MNIEMFLKEMNKFGMKYTFHDAKYLLYNKLIFYKELQGMTLSMNTVQTDYLSFHSDYEFRFLTETELLAYSHDMKNELSKELIEKALHNGDRCYGVIDHGNLVSYGWYSSRPTLINDDLILCFDDHWTYMYKGYTKPSHRGQRLHAIGMAKAMQAYSNKGFLGLISYVETNNFYSLRSVERVGYKNLSPQQNLWVTSGSGRAPSV